MFSVRSLRWGQKSRPELQLLRPQLLQNQIELVIDLARKRPVLGTCGHAHDGGGDGGLGLVDVHELVAAGDGLVLENLSQLIEAEVEELAELLAAVAYQLNPVAYPIAWSFGSSFFSLRPMSFR